MKVLSNIVLIGALLILLSPESLLAQCETWVNSPKKDQAENAHVIYRPYVKNKKPEDLAKLGDEDFNIAFDNWQKAYELAPAANGKINFHFTDGRKLLKAKMLRIDDAEEKKKLAQRVVDLYDQELECFPKMGSRTKEDLLALKGKEMLYLDGFGFGDATLEAFENAIEAWNNSTSLYMYQMFDPLGQLIVNRYQNDKMGEQKARELYLQLEKIANYNIENSKKYSQYYEYGMNRLDKRFREIEDQVFDCDYFRGKLMPQVEANPDSLSILRYVYNKLKTQGCDPEAEFMVELKAKYESIASEVNAQREAEFLAKNPGIHARRLYDEGKYQEAIDKFQEAIDQAESDSIKAEYYFGIASIQYRRLNQYSTARATARKAAEMRDNWGRPYMLIGDMYAATSSRCGEDWDNRMAVIAAIDKYNYAKSIDPSVAEEANEKIRTYNGSLPEKQEGFMRGVQAGQEVRVNCWIGETVKVRFK